jgi:hypothetical protein
LSESSSITSHIAIQLTGFFIGTQASIKDKQLAQTLAIEVDPFDDKTSETILIVYGNLFSSGIIGLSVFSAKCPCQISLLHCHL